MSLRDKVKNLSENRKRFLLMRVAGLDTASSRKLVGIVTSTYNTWLQSREFVELYRQLSELQCEYRQEAIQMLRRDNQLEAVLLEGTLIKKMKAELDAGEYDLIRTNLAREVYSKLITDLDVVPQTQVLSWQQRVSLITNQPPQIAEVVDAEFQESAESQELGSEQIEPAPSQIEQAGESSPNEVEEATED